MSTIDSNSEQLKLLRGDLINKVTNSLAQKYLAFNPGISQSEALEIALQTYGPAIEYIANKELSKVVLLQEILAHENLIDQLGVTSEKLVEKIAPDELKDLNSKQSVINDSISESERSTESTQNAVQKIAEISNNIENGSPGYSSLSTQNKTKEAFDQSKSYVTSEDSSKGGKKKGQSKNENGLGQDNDESSDEDDTDQSNKDGKNKDGKAGSTTVEIEDPNAKKEDEYNENDSLNLVNGNEAQRKAAEDKLQKQYGPKPETEPEVNKGIIEGDKKAESDFIKRYAPNSEDGHEINRDLLSNDPAVKAAAEDEFIKKYGKKPEKGDYADPLNSEQALKDNPNKFIRDWAGKEQRKESRKEQRENSNSYKASNKNEKVGDFYDKGDRGGDGRRKPPEIFPGVTRRDFTAKTARITKNTLKGVGSLIGAGGAQAEQIGSSLEQKGQEIQQQAEKKKGIVGAAQRMVGKDLAKTGSDVAAAGQAMKVAGDQVKQQLSRAAARAAISLLPAISGLMVVLLCTAVLMAVIILVLCKAMENPVGEAVTRFAGVPAEFKQICKGLGFSGCDTSSTTSGSIGGTPCTNESITVDGLQMPDVAWLPDNENLYYFMLATRAQEVGGLNWTNTTAGDSDRDSCGPYQQRINEFFPGGGKANAARQIMGEAKYNQVFKGAPSSSESYGEDSATKAEALSYCKLLIATTGPAFFDQVFVQRIKDQGQYEKVLAGGDPSIYPKLVYDVQIGEPKNEKIINTVRAAKQNKLFDQKKKKCGLGGNDIKPNSTTAFIRDTQVSNVVFVAYQNTTIQQEYISSSSLLGLTKVQAADTGFINGTQTQAVNGNRIAGSYNSVRGGTLAHNDKGDSLSATDGFAIYSPVSGKVVTVVNSYANNVTGVSGQGDFGNVVGILVDKGPFAGKTYWLGHIDQNSNNLKPGDIVNIGQKIGAAQFGSGSGTGAHFSDMIGKPDDKDMIDANSDIAATAKLAGLKITGDGKTATVTLGDGTTGTGTNTGSSTSGSSSGCSTTSTTGTTGPGTVNQDKIQEYVNKDCKGEIPITVPRNVACAFTATNILKTINPALADKIGTADTWCMYNGTDCSSGGILNNGGKIVGSANEIQNYGLVFYGTNPSGNKNSPEALGIGHVGVVYKDKEGKLREVSNYSSSCAHIHSSPEEAASVYSGSYGGAVYIAIQ